MAELNDPNAVDLDEWIDVNTDYLRVNQGIIEEVGDGAALTSTGWSPKSMQIAEYVTRGALPQFKSDVARRAFVCDAARFVV